MVSSSSNIGTASDQSRPCFFSTGSMTGRSLYSSSFRATGPATASSRFRNCSGSVSAFCSSSISLTRSNAGRASAQLRPRLCSAGSIFGLSAASSSFLAAGPAAETNDFRKSAGAVSAACSSSIESTSSSAGLASSQSSLYE